MAEEEERYWAEHPQEQRLDYRGELAELDDDQPILEVEARRHMCHNPISHPAEAMLDLANPTAIRAAVLGIGRLLYCVRGHFAQPEHDICLQGAGEGHNFFCAEPGVAASGPGPLTYTLDIYLTSPLLAGQEFPEPFLRIYSGRLTDPSVQAGDDLKWAEPPAQSLWVDTYSKRFAAEAESTGLPHSIETLAALIAPEVERHFAQRKLAVSSAIHASLLSNDAFLRSTSEWALHDAYLAALLRFVYRDAVRANDAFASMAFRQTETSDLRRLVADVAEHGVPAWDLAEFIRDKVDERRATMTSHAFRAFSTRDPSFIEFEHSAVFW